MPGLRDLPDEIILLILKTGLLHAADFAALTRSCRRLNAVAEETLYKHNRDRQGSSAVLWAAEYGSIATLENALAHGLCIKDENLSLTPGPSPLQMAVMCGQDSAVAWLLDHGADLTRDVRPHCRCHYTIKTCVLHIAFCFGHASTARLLISRGAPLEYKSPKPTNPGTYVTTALLEASFYGFDTIVELLVKEHGMDPQTRGGFVHYDALACAARNANNVSMIKLLVYLGADVDGPHKWWNLSPLHLAIIGGNFAVAHALLDAGARITPYGCDVDAVSESRSTSKCKKKTRTTILPMPLHDAIAWIYSRNPPNTYLPGFIQVETNEPWRAERIGFIKRLIELGVDVNMEAEGDWVANPLLYRESPLCFAAAVGDTKDVAILIEAGAKVKDETLGDALYLFDQHPEASVEKIKLLIEHGAKLDSVVDTTTMLQKLVRLNKRHGSFALHEALLMSSPENLSQEHLDEVLEECLCNRPLAYASTTLVHHGACVSGEDKLYSIARTMVARLTSGKRGNSSLDLIGLATSWKAQALYLSMGIAIDMGLSGPDQDLIFKDILRKRQLALAHLFLDRGLLSRPEAEVLAPAYLMLASSWGNVCVIKRLWQLPRKAPDETLSFFLVQESIALGNREAVSFFMRHGANPFQYLTHTQVSRERRLREDATAARAEAAKIYLLGPADCLQARRRFHRTQLLTWRHDLAEYIDAYLLPFLSPLQFAVRCGRTKIVSDLLGHVSQDDTSAISRCGKVWIPCVLTTANEISEMIQKNGIECE